MAYAKKKIHSIWCHPDKKVASITNINHPNQFLMVLKPFEEHTLSRDMFKEV